MEHKGIDCNYIANKIIIELKQTKDENSLMLTCGRLTRLILLTDIAYMQKHNKFLVRNAYAWWSRGIVLPKIFYTYNGTAGNALAKDVELIDGVKQQDYENSIGASLLKEINAFVKKVLDMTKYVDTLDLIDFLEVELDEEPDTIIMKDRLALLYKNLDFNKLKELNEKEKQEICGV